MRFVFGKQDLADSARRAEHCFLLTNGLGGLLLPDPYRRGCPQ